MDMNIIKTFNADFYLKTKHLQFESQAIANSTDVAAFKKVMEQLNLHKIPFPNYLFLMPLFLIKKFCFVILILS